MEAMPGEQHLNGLELTALESMDLWVSAEHTI